MLKQLHHFLRGTVLTITAKMHQLVAPFIPLQQFRYAACGGGNTVLNILIYFISYNFILQKQLVHLSFISISPHIAAFIIAFCITFPIGFYLNLFVVFEGSLLKRRIQLLRYFVVVMGCVILNYLFIKLFVEKIGWYPTPSATLTTVIVTVFSYLMQRNYSFKSSSKKIIDNDAYQEGK